MDKKCWHSISKHPMTKTKNGTKVIPSVLDEVLDCNTIKPQILLVSRLYNYNNPQLMYNHPDKHTYTHFIRA